MNYSQNKTTTILTGVLAVILGLLLIAMPGMALFTFILFFAFYLMLFGIIRIIDSFRLPQGDRLRLPWLILGVIAFLAGLGLFIYPAISSALLAYLIAFYSISIGVVQVIAGFGMRGSVGREILLIIAGILSVIFGIYLFIYPNIGIALLTLFYGWYSLIYGVILIIHGFRKKAAVA